MRRGVGMYPDEACFDPDRPSLLPYWLDDLTESQCKINLLVSGNTTGNTAQPGQPGAAASTISNAQSACASQGGTWDSVNLVCTPSFLNQYGYWILGAAAIGAVLIYVVKK